MVEIPRPRSIQLRQTIHRALVDLENIPESKMSHKPDPDKWSKKEILGHLIDSAMNNHRRIVLASQSDQLIFEGYNQVHWVLSNNYQDRPTREILSLWMQMNLHLAAAYDAVAEELVTKIHIHHNFHQIAMRPVQENQPLPLTFLMDDYLIHLEHHLKQVFTDA